MWLVNFKNFLPLCILGAIGFLIPVAHIFGTTKLDSLIKVGFIYPVSPMTQKGGVDIYSYKEPMKIILKYKDGDALNLNFENIYLDSGNHHRVRMAFYYDLFYSIIFHDKNSEKRLTDHLCKKYSVTIDGSNLESFLIEFKTLKREILYEAHCK